MGSLDMEGVTAWVRTTLQSLGPVLETVWGLWLGMAVAGAFLGYLGVLRRRAS